ncbi:uncharacterized protein LOC129594676 [Paramacrobiotus metropolitanus]|uniref:uncharacterized protein LOC129594676 n=1 Tax=Paramacrobiotus metropolitanus TaxID=2943436 RepID=UPI0024458A02|nr:uncharacterized protein LOC129594676 [Paramacrobiotus metropolitanus]
MKLLQTLLINIILFPACLMHDGHTDLETDCNTFPNIAQTTAVEPIAFPFRTDLLTREECLLYAELSQNGAICSPVFDVEECEKTSNDEFLLTPPSRSYIDVRCSWENRTILSNITKNIHLISPTRAAIIMLKERSDSFDPVHAEVIGPIRKQLVELRVPEIRTTIISAKIYDIGMLPNLILLGIGSGLRLEIQKKHFSRMPQIRSITFSGCTIAALEPYTFTDLPHLQSLSLEDGVGYNLYQIEKYDAAMRRVHSGMLSDEDLEMFRKLHCDCSYAWYRNFLKQKPDLISDKRKGEVAIVGNYMTPSVDMIFAFLAAVLRVDCAQNLTYTNVERTMGGSQYSYNTSCYNLQC